MSTPEQRAASCARTKKWADKKRLVDPQFFARKSREWREKNPLGVVVGREKYARENPGAAAANNKKARFRKALWASRKNAKAEGHQPCFASEAELGASFTGKCFVCGAPEAEQKRRLHLDHCHTTGRFRGWLCSPCNTGIGLLGDSIEGVTRALEYLKNE